jgi:CRP/FNR family transcriptional regulator, cyclic AMP receptor protein
MLGQKIELLENLPIFRGLSRKQLGMIADAATKAFFEPGDCLIEKDAPGDTAYLILTGTAKCLQFPGTQAASGNAGPGCLAGELAMLIETVHTLTVQAMERLRALAIHREMLRGIMERDPAIAQQISENLLLRLQNFAQELRKVDSLLLKAEGAEQTVEKSQAGAKPLASLPPLMGRPQSIRKFG